MAKKKAKSNKKLMEPKEVLVKSRAYGVHTRAARGSLTPVKLNDAFKEHVAKTVVINGAAKRVHDVLKVVGSHFKEAMLWQKMLSRMRKAASDGMEELLLTLQGMELNEKYPLRRFVNADLPRIKSHKDALEVSLHTAMPPLIKNGDTQYQYELWLLALGKKVKDDVVLKQESFWRERDDKNAEMTFVFSLPEKTKYCVLCLHFMSGNNGKATGTLASRGMRIVGVGKR